MPGSAGNRCWTPLCTTQGGSSWLTNGPPIWRIRLSQLSPPHSLAVPAEGARPLRGFVASVPRSVFLVDAYPNQGSVAGTRIYIRKQQTLPTLARYAITVCLREALSSSDTVEAPPLPRVENWFLSVGASSKTLLPGNAPRMRRPRTESRSPNGIASGCCRPLSRYGRPM